MNTLVAVVRIYLVLGQEKPCEVFLEFGGYRQSDILLRKSKTWRYKLQRFHLTILSADRGDRTHDHVVKSHALYH
uniref:Uncharacterized protein n=1 Tax=Oryza glumipatula TaxID=40148 RepID=A0A0E0BPZ4_9ORYZ